LEVRIADEWLDLILPEDGTGYCLEIYGREHFIKGQFISKNGVSPNEASPFPEKKELEK